MTSVKLNNSAPIKVHGLPEGGGSGGSGIETKFLIFKDHYDAATQNHVPLLDISFQELSEIYTKYTNHQINLVVLLAKDSGDNGTERTITKTHLTYVDITYKKAQPKYGMNNDFIQITASGLYSMNTDNKRIVYIDQWAIKDDDTITYNPIRGVNLQAAN